MVEGQVLQDELDKLQRQNPQTMIESQMKRKNWGIAEKPEIEVVVGDDVRCDQSKKQKPDDKNEQLWSKIHYLFCYSIFFLFFFWIIRLNLK